VTGSGFYSADAEGQFMLGFNGALSRDLVRTLLFKDEIIHIS
jgi:hypothetical protein